MGPLGPGAFRVTRTIGAIGATGSIGATGVIGATEPIGATRDGYDRKKIGKLTIVHENCKTIDSVKLQYYRSIVYYTELTNTKRDYFL